MRHKKSLDARVKEGHANLSKLSSMKKSLELNGEGDLATLLVTIGRHCYVLI